MPNPFSLEQEQGILHHMNRDHAEAIKHYCDLYNIQVTDDQNPVMIGIDSEGFHIRIGKRIHRINFRQSVNTNEEARKALIEIARQDAG
jgi:putative heme iron utilization protein